MLQDFLFLHIVEFNDITSLFSMFVMVLFGSTEAFNNSRPYLHTYFSLYPYTKITSTSSGSFKSG